MTMVWDRFPKGGSKLLTMLALADWCDDSGGRLFPSHEGVAAKIRMSKRQAQRLLEWLIKHEFVKNLTPDNAGGKTNQYLIRLDTLARYPVIKRDTWPDVMAALKRDGDNLSSDDSNGDNLSSNVDTAMSRNVDAAVSTEPLEPSYKPSVGEAERAEVAGLLKHAKQWAHHTKTYNFDQPTQETARQDVVRLQQRLAEIDGKPFEPELEL